MIPRSEHPRPQFVRDSWLNLNGQWDFAFDFSVSGLDRKFYENGEYTHKITVPFCPESRLSGIGYTDFIPAVWYRRTVTLTQDQLMGEVLLHFGAVDYETVVYVNGKEAGRHIGGYASFSFEIGKFLQSGENIFVVYARDDTRSGKQPSGKQSGLYHSHGCHYTRTTGIWQTVWLEFVPKVYIKKLRVYPNATAGSVTLAYWLSRPVHGFSIQSTASFNGKTVCERLTPVDGEYATETLPLSNVHLWDIGNPHLYDLQLRLIHENEQIDKVSSYFGLRIITLHDGAMCLNGRPVFQRLVLDQGFYPDGIYTAPSDAALIEDIELSMSIGFNGARLHEKAFEERFLYHADRLGYLVWGEYANWGFDHSTTANIAQFLPEWLEIVERDFNHPALIGWCPFNETWDENGKRQDDNLLRMVYLATKAVDATRPVIDTSGNYHVITDVYDVHDYEQDIEKFRGHYARLKKGEAHDPHSYRQRFGGQPYFVSEYGGARWAPEADKDSWGYGNAPKTEEEFADRYKGLTETLINAEGICALCYTQLYDVEQEKNGLFTYDRQKKFSDETYARIKAANEQKAAIE
ncbi:MAG: beta-galactosidase [Defluviitaleaceae bacterium]|nr:beta-galactosidase [Defluviitaleaceae bacterium]